MSLTKATYAMTTGAPVNVLDYGADPTGVVDSTDAINAAIVAGTRVYMPAGTYKISDTITDSGRTTILYGDGHNDTGDDVTKILNTEDVNSVNFSGFGSQLECLYIEGPGGTYTGTGHGIYWQAARGHIQNVTVTQHRGHGLWYQKDNCCTFDTITLINNAGHGLYMDHAPDIIFDNNASSFINIDCRINGKSGIADAGSSSFACTFVGATLQGNAEYGLNCFADFYTFVGLYCEANTINDVQFGSTANYNRVFGYFSNKSPISSSITGNTTGTNYVYSGGGATEQFKTPTLLNSWANKGSGYQDARYWRDGSFIVHLDGYIASGTSIATDIFQLDAGFRPAAAVVFPVYTATGFGAVQINASGVVTGISGSTAGLSLSGITFIAGN